MSDAVGAFAAMGVLACIGSMLIAAGAPQSRMQVCMTRLKNLGIANASFANDNAGKIASLNWSCGQRNPSSYADLRRFESQSVQGEIDAVACQAVDILRRRGGRTDISPIQSWIASASFNHLAIQDYLGQALPSPLVLCPEDSIRLAWQSDPTNFNNLPGVPSPAPPGSLSNADKRWPYGSSYKFVSAAWTNDLHTPNSGAWYFYSFTSVYRSGGLSPGGDIGKRRMAQVAFPGQKVMMYDEASRHFAPRQVYWGFADSKQPALFFDGATRTIHPGAANPGMDFNRGIGNPGSYAYVYDNTNAPWLPRMPESVSGTTFTFASASWAATRAGLEGRDIDGPEVFTHSLLGDNGGIPAGNPAGATER